MESFEYTVKVTVPESLRGLFGKDPKKETEAVQKEVERRLSMKDWNPKIVSAS